METTKKQVRWDKIKDECNRFDQSEFWPHLREDEEDLLSEWIRNLRSVAEICVEEEEMEN